MVLKCDILIGVMRVMPVDIPTATAKSFLIAIGAFSMDRFHTARVFRIQTGDKCGLVSAPPAPAIAVIAVIIIPPVAANRMMDMTESEVAAMQIRSRNPGKLDNERAPFSALETIPKSLVIYSPH
ncbi:unnamed protein product [Spirodela intermedia]|uniref:Uncharacterized protein n=1 Tax=Spirodela intermedia TaxID=51605 RepID=A0A7I8LEY1_SPIIN|nr:unnamed protein product [Spirodela intermedia]